MYIILGGFNLKAITRAIDRFCYRHPNFGIPNLMLYIIIGNAIVFVFSMMDRTNTFLYYLYFNPALIMQGQIWRLVTFIFVPMSTDIFWEAISLYCYYSIGNLLERFWGPGKFTLYYIGGVISTIIYGILVSLFFSDTIIQYLVFLDGFYINLSLFLALAAVAPDMQFLFFFIIPIKAKYLAIFTVVLEFWQTIRNPFPLNLLPLVAFLNFIFFCGGYIWNNTGTFRRSHSKQASRFRATVKRAQDEQAARPYKHKCAVCGRTDVSNPELEFRYCSRCAGYHCFCEDHINNHVHFTE